MYLDKYYEAYTIAGFYSIWSINLQNICIFSFSLSDIKIIILRGHFFAFAGVVHVMHTF